MWCRPFQCVYRNTPMIVVGIRDNMIRMVDGRCELVDASIDGIDESIDITALDVRTRHQHEDGHCAAVCTGPSVSGLRDYVYGRSSGRVWLQPHPNAFRLPKQVESVICAITEGADMQPVRNALFGLAKETGLKFKVNRCQSSGMEFRLNGDLYALEALVSKAMINGRAPGSGAVWHREV